LTSEEVADLVLESDETRPESYLVLVSTGSQGADENERLTSMILEQVLKLKVIWFKVLK